MRLTPAKLQAMNTSTLEQVWHPTKAAWARARAAELDGQARQLEQSSAGNWRQRARTRAAASRLRLRAGDYLAKAARLEDDEEPVSQWGT